MTSPNLPGTMGRVMRRGFMLLVVATLSACTTTQFVEANSTPVRQSDRKIPDNLLLDIGVLPFEPNVPKSESAQKKELIDPNVRRAESQYIAYHLKSTLELTGDWGAVRVIPETSDAVDLTITGKILVSDGEQLKGHVTAIDSQGRVWIDKDYTDSASKYAYNDTQEDPFQDFYNKIANDLLTRRDRMNNQQLATIRQVSALKYARDLSPEAFSRYLNERGGLTTFKELPADTNDMLARVTKIKQREYRFVDTLDNYYSKFNREMKPSYDEWRHSTYKEAVRLRMLDAQARNRILGGAALVLGGLYAGQQSNTYAGQAASIASVVGGIGTIKTGLDKKAESEINRRSLQELSQSLGSEIKPYVLDVEGRTIELKGSADQQFKQWQKLLKQIYVEETGLPAK